MEKHGEIRKLMLSFELNHKSKGFGFAYYRHKESAEKAINHGAHLEPDQIVAIPSGGNQHSKK